MAHYSRAEIPLRPATRITEHPNNPAPQVFIHHTAGAAAPTIGRALTQWREVQAYHMDNRGWTDIAYTKGVAQSGDSLQGRGWERQGGATGPPYDSTSHSICAIGNFEEEHPTPNLLEGIARLIRNGIDKGYLSSNVAVRAHKDAAATACPGRHLVAELDRIEALVHGGTGATDPDMWEDIDDTMERVAKQYRQLGNALTDLETIIGQAHHG